MAVVRIIMFAISTLGTLEWLRMESKDRISIYFLPSLAIAIQTTVLFLAGLLNLLSEMTYLLFVIGLVGIIYSIYKNRGMLFLKNYMNTGYVCMLLVMTIMLLFVRGKIFTHYDNFSHWALVVKQMLRVNRYPNFEDTLIMFQEYPLGSATYIYYFAKLISTSESIQMLAQIYIMAAAILPLFIFVKKNRILSAIAMVSFTNFVFVYNITITNLLVDTVLPIVGMCGLLFAYLYCRKKCGKLEFVYLAFYMVQVVQIKNSGMFFVVLIDALIFVYGWKNRQCIISLLSGIMPFVSLILWQKHCKYLFSSAATSKHAMTMENYSAVLEGKTSEDIREICVSLFKFATTWKDVWLTVVVCVLIGIGIWAVKANIWKIYIRICCFSFVMYAIYQLGMLAMYVFSMPLYEAIVLAAATRYTKTVLLAVLYLEMIPTLEILSEMKLYRFREIITTIGLCMSLFVFLFFSFGKIKLAVQYTDDPTERKWLEQAKNEYNVPNGSSYCVLIPKKDAGYAGFLGKYICQSNSVSARVIESEEDIDNVTAKYIFVYDQGNEITNEWIKNYYPDQYGNDVIMQKEK